MGCNCGNKKVCETRERTRKLRQEIQTLMAQALDEGAMPSEVYGASETAIRNIRRWIDSGAWPHATRMADKYGRSV